MRYRCYAKINLTLEIVRRRPDGFHDLASLVHTISLADDLAIEPAETLASHVAGQAIDPQVNLVSRAARRLASDFEVKHGADLRLVKRIPPAAGLGGGSSDAAATLVGLNSLWHTRLSVTALCQVAADLGSDIPFFVRGGAALMRGRGDELEILPALTEQWLVLIVPRHDLADKTRRLYAALDPTDFSSGEATARAADSVRRGAAPEDGDLVNAFSRAARAVFPGLAEVWQRAECTAGRKFFLSGAGPALFALATTRAEARNLARRLDTPGANVYAVRTVRSARASLHSRAIKYA